jgi:hypothetical protein
VGSGSTVSFVGIRKRLETLLTTVGRRICARLCAPEACGPRQRLDALTAVPNLFTLQTIRVAVTLGLPDLIDGGISDAPGLAAATDTNRDALSRLLRHLVARGVIVEPSPGRVGLSDVGRLLLAGHPDQQAAYLHLDAAPILFDAAVREMMYSIRTGLPAWSQVHPKPFWEYVSQNRTVATSFDQDMRKRVLVLGPELVTGYDWNRLAAVVDVGGGNGALIAQLLTSYENMHGTIVEAAAAVERVQLTLREAGLVGRCDVVIGSFFDPLPPGADVYLLSWVLHDWGDDDAVRILTRCHEAAGTRGRILVLEQPSDVVPATELDLRMLLYFGGRERSRSEYERLAIRSGFSRLTWTPLPSGSWILDCRS